jgi:heat shock protein HslJ
MTRSLLSILLAFILGCASTASETSIDNTKWTLVQYIDSAGTATSVTYPNGKRDNGYWVGFKQDTIYGLDNCNHFSGHVTVENSTMKTSDILSTLIGCPENLEMIPALGMATHFEVENKTLRIYSAHTKLSTLIFKQID